MSFIFRIFTILLILMFIGPALYLSGGTIIIWIASPFVLLFILSTFFGYISHR